MITSNFRVLTPVAILSLIAALGAIKGQSPEPIVVPAATGTSLPTASAASASATSMDPAGLQVAIQTLQRLKSANEEVIKRQEATLQQLDEIQQAAEELKIFAKRG